MQWDSPGDWSSRTPLLWRTKGGGSVIRAQGRGHSESWKHEGLETRMLPKVGRRREKFPHPPSFQPPASCLYFSLAEFGWKPGSLWLEGAGRGSLQRFPPLPCRAGQGQCRTLGPDQRGLAQQKWKCSDDGRSGWLLNASQMAGCWSTRRFLFPLEEGAKGIPGIAWTKARQPESQAALVASQAAPSGCRGACGLVPVPLSSASEATFPECFLLSVVTQGKPGWAALHPEYPQDPLPPSQNTSVPQCSHLGRFTSSRQQQFRAEASYLWYLGPVTPPGLWWRCRCLGGNRAVRVSDFQRLVSKPWMAGTQSCC